MLFKCMQCGRWHRIGTLCPTAAMQESPIDVPASAISDVPYLYRVKKRLVTANEQGYFIAIQTALPAEYHIYPQVNLAAVIERTDNARYCNELFRNLDFLVTDENYVPRIAIEINDQTHQNAARRERDRKVQQICEEAGLPLVTLWTSYGIQPDYIQKRLTEALETPPVRVHHFSKAPDSALGSRNVASAPTVIPSYAAPDSNRQGQKPQSPAWAILLAMLILLLSIVLFALYDYHIT